MTVIGEPISVIAAFGGYPTKMRPVRFRWSGRVFEIEDITYHWVSKEGTRVLYHFSVTVGATLYEIVFDSQRLLWSLEKIET
jgi:hypothetical protein